MSDAAEWLTSRAKAIDDLVVKAHRLAWVARAESPAHGRDVGHGSLRATAPDDPATARLLARYVRAWETADVALLVATLRADAELLMPPSPSWYAGRDTIATFAARHLFPGGAAGRFSLVPTRANGEPAFLVAAGGEPMGIQVVTVTATGIERIVVFLDPGVVGRFAP